ncbi:hypothetical protein KY285_037605 [Solanum tuberosum]|nr:hypothetical protein KY285_037605 [Solanum tuberosum]
MVDTTQFEDIISQLASLRTSSSAPPPAPPPATDTPFSSILGRSSMARPPPLFQQPFFTSSPAPPLNPLPSEHHVTFPQHPFSTFGRDKPASIDFPKFDRTNAESWVFQAHQYFDAYGLSSEHHLNFCSFFLEGEAREWYQWMYRNRQLCGWEHFLKSLVTRFGSKSMEAPEALLSKLQMQSSVGEYLSQFEKLANQTSDVSSLLMKHIFTSGLHPDIKSDVLDLSPSDLNDAISLAFLQEQKRAAQSNLVTWPTYSHTNPNRYSLSQTYTKTPTQATLSSTTPIASIPGVGRVPFKKLTLVELQRKRDLHLCFNCDEKYQKGHRCSSSRQLLLLLVDDDPVDVFPSNSSPPPSDSPPPNTSPENPSLLTISFQVLSGGPHPSTLRFTGFIRGISAQILIDGGSTHNFIQPSAVKALKLLVEPSSNFSVMAFNSDRFHLLLPPHRFAINALIIPPTHPTDLSVLLNTYSDVFQPPKTLPLSRPQDHHIPLLPGANPVNDQPYRYPHFQKTEIKRLVSDMLQSGVILPSSSPYSSPILLVRKKDGTWHSYVDYRALNAITVKDRFPIPTVDELFDELNMALFFSKLDLLAGYHQIRLHPPNIEKTAFRTHEGHYEFTVMPFDFSNAPSTF